MEAIDNKIKYIFNTSFKIDHRKDNLDKKEKVLNKFNNLEKNISYKNYRKYVEDEVLSRHNLKHDELILLEKLYQLYKLKEEKQNKFYLKKIISIAISDTYHSPSNETFSKYLNLLKKDYPFIKTSELYTKIKQNQYKKVS